jgi:molecular chaperone GrpE
VGESKEEKPETGMVLKRVSVPLSEYRALERKANRLRTIEESPNFVKDPEAFFRSLFDLFDDFERSLQAARADGVCSGLEEGLELVLKKSKDLLKSQGIEVIPSVGVPFDPALHAFLHGERVLSGEPFVIEKEYRCGYRRGNIVLRKSLVG